MQTKPAPAALPVLSRLAPDASNGVSGAVVVDASATLLHTAQLLPLDAAGRLVGVGDAAQQLDRTVANLRLALEAAGAGLEDLVRLHVYAASDAVAAAVRQRLGDVFRETGAPAVSFVVTRLPHPAALVAVDGVAAVAARADAMALHHVPALGGPQDHAHVSVMPPGGKVFLSGQALPGPLPEATRRTMEDLHRTLSHLGLQPSDVFQVKAFLHPMADAAEVAAIVRSFYPGQPAPPLVFVEWTDGGYLSYLSLDEADGPLPIEIELHAYRRSPRAAGEAVSYGTPPWMDAPATYSRVAEVHRGDLVYVSGLYGDPAQDAEAQTRSLFAQLERLLQQAGSSFDHLVKGTYYVTGEAASDHLNQVRTEFYDPKRAPTSSKMPVRGVGLEGAVITFDMIGVVPGR